MRDKSTKYLQERLAARISQFRDERELTQEEISELLMMSPRS